MPEPENFMRVPSPTPRRTLYTDAMEIFHRAADIIGLNARVRLELEEPDYEHIFYVTAKLKDRLVPLAQGRRNAVHGPARDAGARPRRAGAAGRRAIHPQREGAARLRRRPSATAHLRLPDGERLPAGAGRVGPLQGLPRPAQPGPRPVQGRHPLPPRRVARPLQGAGRRDDLEDGHRRRALRRRQGRHQDRPAPVRPGGAGGHHPALHVQAEEPGRPEHRHPRAGRRHQRGDHGAR